MGRSVAEDREAVDAPGLRRLVRGFSEFGVIFNSEGRACTCTRYYLLLTTCTWCRCLYGRFGPLV